MEIASNVHRLRAGAANCYLCVDDNGLLLIDAGSPNQADNVFNAMERIGHHATALTHILVTHADWDHAGSLAELQARSGARVVAAEETAAWLQQGKSPQHMPRPVQFIADRFFGYRPVPATVLQIVADGDTLPFLGGMAVLATPGHTPDHHSFYSPAHGILFAGDALSTRPGRLRLPRAAINADVDAARRSARRLLALTPAIFACGHGEPLREHTLADVMALLKTLDSPD